MRPLARFAISGLIRSPAATLVRIAVLALATALLGAMLLFVGHSLRVMTGGAVRSVPLDWQGPVASYGAARKVASETAHQPGVAAATPAATAPFTGATTRAGGSTVSSGSGAVLAVPPSAVSGGGAFRMLQGKLAPGTVVLDQQLAATLRAQIGGTVSLKPSAKAAPVRFKVGGVAVVTHPDVLFQPLDPAAGPAAAQPPANVAILPLDAFASRYAAALPSLAAAATGASAQPGAQTGVQWQVQGQVDPHAFDGLSPSAAYARAGQIRSAVERTLPGQVRYVDNLADGLSLAAEDALYAEALYVMLAVPGALIALGLAYLAGLGTAERDRRELALLRARGATRRRLAGLALFESTIVGTLAGVAGAGIALAAIALLGTGGSGRLPLALIACVLLGIAGAAVARVATTAAALRANVAAGRRGEGRERMPLWQRLYLDVAALIGSGLITWLTARTGFSAVLSPDANPTLSLSVYMFFGPALLWLGATLLLVRFRGRAVAWMARRAAGGRSLVLISAARRGAAINRGLILVALLLAFGVQLGLFAATYDRQATVDAQLTLGADVVATAAPGVTATHDLPGRIARVPGVTATTPVDHSYAYVGPDLQDTYGIDTRTLPHATTLRDSYFPGSSAAGAMRALAGRPDGILVSQETITDFALEPGDLLKLRVLDRSTGAFRVVPFHVAGVVAEFPSAPKDSFMVANLPYLRAASHDAGPNTVFASAAGDPAATARRVAAAARGYGAAVKDIVAQRRETVSSITTVDLAGVTRIEEAFAVLLAGAAMALFVALGVTERRRELATMAAIGAPARRIGAYVYSEAALVLGASLVLAAGLGFALAEMLVAMLTHVFDPPPDALAVPWGFLAALAGAATLAAVIATALAGRRLGRLPLGRILREQ